MTRKAEKKSTYESITFIIDNGHKAGLLVSWCFEPCQPLGVTSGLKTNSNLSLSYPAHQSFNIYHNILQHSYFEHTHMHTQNHTYLNKPIHLHFFPQNLSGFLLCWLWLTHGSCVGPQNKTGHPARCRFAC